jgi:hypothetical protein
MVRILMFIYLFVSQSDLFSKIARKVQNRLIMHSLLLPQRMPLLNINICKVYCQLFLLKHIS